jgi:hypothetical protein
MSQTKEQNDEFCLNLIQNTESAEVKPWLQDDSKSRTLGILEGTEESIEFIQEVFDRGAVQVFAVEIDSYDDSENTGKICLELPDDLGLRQQVLEWASEISEEQGFDPEFDIGQRYVFMMLD